MKIDENTYNLIIILAGIATCWQFGAIGILVFLFCKV